MEITDNGPGIAGKAVAHLLFEPFKTTKDGGSGSGLCMAGEKSGGWPGWQCFGRKQEERWGTVYDQATIGRRCRKIQDGVMGIAF